MLMLQKDEATAARRRIPLYLVDSGDGITPETAVSPGAAELKVSKNGAGEANFDGSWNNVGNGLYYYEATAAELDTVGYISLRLAVAGVRTFIAVAQVVAVDLYDDVRAGLTALPNAAAEAAGGLFTRGTGAGQINQPANGQIDAKTVDITHDAIDADAIKADAITEIQAGMATANDTNAILAAAEDIQARIPTELAGGMMSSYVGGIELATAQALAAVILDLADGVETGVTVRETLRGVAAVLLGKTSGGPDGTVFRNAINTKDRVTSVADASGNRTTVTLDLT